MHACSLKKSYCATVCWNIHINVRAPQLMEIIFFSQNNTRLVWVFFSIPLCSSWNYRSRVQQYLKIQLNFSTMRKNFFFFVKEEKCLHIETKRVTHVVKKELKWAAYICLTWKEEKNSFHFSDKKACVKCL